MHFDIGLDLFPLIAAILASVACGVLGNFLVLRRLSLMGDAISHSVLPGLVIAFLLSASRSPLIMFTGAAIAGVCTVVLVELVKKLGRIEPGAAMGVVFSILFALGVLLIEQAAARHVDLDADCVLYGQLEALAWFDAPASLRDLLSMQTLHAIPRQVSTLAWMCALALLFTIVLFKELRIAAFDPAVATSLGFHAGLLHYALMILVAAATVAAFEAVGSILVIAMLICPAVTARLLTDRLHTQIALSVAIAILTSVGGYIAAAAIPAFFGIDAINAAGSMAVTAGALLTLTIVLAPRHGLLAHALRQRSLSHQIALDDLLATLYRASESIDPSTTNSAISPLTLHAPEQLLAITPSVSTISSPNRSEAPSKTTIAKARTKGWVKGTGSELKLTPQGWEAARSVIRRHRLWESYLVDEAGIAQDHVHDLAERLEHLPVAPHHGPRIDPHGKPIPPTEPPAHL